MAEPHDIGAGARKRRNAKRKDAQHAAVGSARSAAKAEPANANRGAPNAAGYETARTRWTVVLGLAALVLAVAAIVSAYLLFASEQTVKKQVAAALTQLRAQIGHQQIIYVPKLTGEPGRAEIFLGSAIGVTWKNFGMTPAKELEYWMSAKWFAAGMEPDFSKPTETLPGHKSMTLAAGAENSSPPLFVPAADIEKAMSGNGRIFFWGDGIYRDAFPDTPLRHFHFCLVAVRMPQSVNEPAAFNAYKPECNYSD